MFDQNNEYKLLEEHLGKNALDEIFAYVNEWPSVDWKTIENARADIERGISETVQHLQSQCTDDCVHRLIPLTVERQVLHILHGVITSILHDDYKEADENFYKKCRDFNEKNVTFGSTKNFDVYLTASIVELANLDSHTDPKSKLDCLVACFDLIYAELKMVLAEEIADSGKENEIPVVDNADAFPLLMCAVVNAKPRYLFSNVEYIRLFCGQWYFNKTTRHIFEMFERAAVKISEVESATMETGEGTLRKELNQRDLNEMMVQTGGEIKASMNRSMKRVTRQIFASLEN